jgi:hypothetical protein
MEEVDTLRRWHACPESMLTDGRHCLCSIQELIIEFEEDHTKGYCIGIKGVGRGGWVRAPKLERYDASGVTRKKRSDSEYY